MRDRVADQLAERLKSRAVQSQRTVFRIFHNVNALTLSWRGPSHDNGDIVVAWQEIIRIEVFKQDLLSVDLICLAIVRRNDKALELNEEMDGWKLLMDKLPEYLPGCQTLEEWFPAVAFPAFRTNRTVIYSRVE